MAEAPSEARVASKHGGGVGCSAEFSEGVQAFPQERPARFTGR